MARREIQYTETKQQLHDTVDGVEFFPVRGFVKVWMCQECGVGVLNKGLHTEYHNVGR